MRKKNILLLLILILVNFLPFISNSVSALPIGNLTVYSPDVGEDVQYWNEIHIKCSAYPNLLIEYEKTTIYIDNIQIFESFENYIDINYGYNGYVGKHTIKFVAAFSMWGTPLVSEESRDIYITSSVDKQDFSDLQIDKLHNLYSLGGQGMTICIVDTGFGFNADATPGSEYDTFPEHVYYDRYNNFREIVYLQWGIDDEPLHGFGVSNAIKKDIWKQIGQRNSNDRSYTKIEDLHGSLVMSTLTQVAPHARYVIIDADSTTFDDGIIWLWDNEFYKTYSIDVLSMSFGGESFDRGYYVDPDIDIALSDMANDPTNPVIHVASTGNDDKAIVWYPAYSSSVIGVGGALDSGDYSYFENCENEDHIIWNFADQNMYTPEYLVDGILDYGFGKTVFKTQPKIDGGSTYDGVQFHDDIADGSIEGLFYAEGDEDLVGALWLRTEEWPDDSNLFKSGYKLRLYRNRFSMYRRYYDGSQSYWNRLVYIYLDDSWTNEWWRMKFETVGNVLKGWLWKEDGTLFRTLYYEDRSEDQIMEGSPGFSARTNLGISNTISIDNIKIVTYDETVDFSGADVNVNWIRYSSWTPSLSNGVKGSNYGDGLDINSIYCGTSINWNPYRPEHPFFNDYSFRGTSNACPLVAGIIALSLQFYNEKPGTIGFLNYLDFNDRTNSIFKSTGEVFGTAPVDNNIIYGNYRTSRGFGLIDAYEIILYINTHY